MALKGAKRFGKLLSILTILTFNAVMVAPLATAVTSPSPTGATISSDLPDYLAGSTVTLTGAGWVADEPVHIYVNDNAGQTWSLNSDPDPVADETGSFTYQFSLPATFIATYGVTATGPTSGTATTTFTDSAGSPPVLPSSVQLTNWATGGQGWITGTLNSSNSNYKEGETVPFRLEMTSTALSASAGPWYAPVCRDYAISTNNGTVYGYTQLKPYNTSRNPNPGGTISSTAGAFDGVGINIGAVDSFLGPSGTVGGITFTCGSTERLVVVTFNVTGTGNLYLLWGGRLSAPGDTGVTYGHSSSFFPGGSLQMRLETPAKTAGINPGGIIQLAQLTVTKVVDSGSATPDEWSFTVVGPNGYNVTQQIASGQSSTAFVGLDTGTYTVTESSVSGYTFAAGSGTNCTFSGSTATCTVTAAAGGATNASATFHNAHDVGYLKITKSFDPLTSGFSGTFAIVYNCGAGNQTVNLAAGASTTVGPLLTGTQCTVTEPTLPTAPAGWTFGTPSIATSPATIVQGDATTAVAVTVTNTISRDTGSLQITKSVSNPDGATLPAAFTGTYTCGGATGTWSVAAGGSQTISGIPTGTVCTVTEVTPTPIAGYTWGTITYSPTSVTITDKAVTYTITVGNSITRDRGSLEIDKTLSNPDGAAVPASFTVNYDCGTGYTGQVSVAPGSPATVNGIPTGSVCTVTEVAPDPIAGYTWGTVTYTPASVTIDTKGGTFTITVGNSITRDRGSLEIDKTVSNPDGATLPASFTVNYDCGVGYAGQVSVAPGSPATVNGIPTGNTCSVTEVAPDPIEGYTWGAITYSPASVVISTKGQTFTITVGNSITRDRGSFKITKSVSNPDGATLPLFTGTYNCGPGYTGIWSVAAGASQTVSGIPTGNICSVVEDPPALISGYSWGPITYTPASIAIDTKDGTFEIVVGNSITRDRGSLEIDKTLSNPDGAAVPASFTVNYDCGAGYTGQVSVGPGSPATVNGIPTGSVCSVTEVAPTPIAGYTWGTITYTPASVTITDKAVTYTITVGNSITRDTGSLQIIKTVTGNVPAGFSQTFNFHVVCTLAGSPNLTYDLSIGYPTTTSVTQNGIPSLYSCSVTEGSRTDVTGYTWGTPLYSASSVSIAKGGTAQVTVSNPITRDKGSLKIVKTVTGTSFSGSFSVTVVCTGDGGTYTPTITYPSPGYVIINNIPTGNTCSVTEPTFPTPPAGYVWGTPAITGSPASISKGVTVEVDVANVLQTGHAQVVKTVGGQPISATNNCMDVSGNIVGCTFQLRQGASTTAVGTTLETQSTLVSGVPIGTLNFTTLLTPGQTYQVCEIVMPGWLTSLGTFVPNSFIPPDGVAPNPAVDNSILCGNFVAQADTTTAVGNIFTIDNTPPPGGRALTIGFWKNWASCTTSSTKKLPVLDETLAKAATLTIGSKTGPGIVVSATLGTYPLFGATYYLSLFGSASNPKVAPDCSKAVNLLNKTTIDGKKKMASDPAFNLAAQLIAAELNYAAGAGKKPAVTAAIQQAVLLLGKYQFNGLTHKPISTADVATMNNLATILDNYNNNRP